MKYKDITIEQVETLYSNNIETVCDADKQEIRFDDILTDIINNFRDGLLNAFNKVIETVKIVIKKVSQIFYGIKGYLIKLFNKKISKKKFIKLLQSYRVQRNDINKLIRNNKEQYTMQRVFESIPPYF